MVPWLVSQLWLMGSSLSQGCSSPGQATALAVGGGASVGELGHHLQEQGDRVQASRPPSRGRTAPVFSQSS